MTPSATPPATPGRTPRAARKAPTMIRDATVADWGDIWPIFKRIIAAGDTYCLPTAMMGGDARNLWFGGPATTVLVAVDPRGAVCGFAHAEPRRLLIAEPFVELAALVVSRTQASGTTRRPSAVPPWRIISPTRARSRGVTDMPPAVRAVPSMSTATEASLAAPSGRHSLSRRRSVKRRPDARSRRMPSRADQARRPVAA